MATYATASASVELTTANLPGLSRGRIAMRPGPNGADTPHPTQPATGAARTAGAGKAPPAPVNQGGTQFTRELSIGIDWFDHVHILPRTPIDFGNVVTDVSEEFEIFNAYNQEVALTAFLNNVGEGITVPLLPTPVALVGAFRSILDPASVRMAPVRITVDASPVGPATFDDFLLFTFSPGGVLGLEVLGSRVALFFPEFMGVVVERLSWLTSITEKLDGTEQRVALRTRPRQSFDVRAQVTTVQRRRLQALLFGWKGRPFGLPLWHERVRMTASATAGAFSVTVDSTAYSDLRIGTLAIVFASDDSYDVVKIESMTTTTITFETALQNSYVANTIVMPLRLALLRGDAQSTRRPVTLEEFEFTFDVVENDIGAPNGSTVGWPTFGTRVLIGDCNYMQGSVDRGAIAQNVQIFDGGTGLLDIESLWERSKYAHSLGLRSRRRADLWSIRQLLYALRGRQKSFVIPTFIEDLEVVENLVGASNQMRIGHIGYTRFIDSKQPKASFRITFTDNTTLTRTILSASEFSATKETLTLDTTWPISRNVSEIVRVELLEISRFDSDTIEIRHSAPGFASVQAPVRVVFDAL